MICINKLASSQKVLHEINCFHRTSPKMAKNENFGSVPAPVCLQDVPVMTCYYSDHRGTETFFGLHCYVLSALKLSPSLVDFFNDCSLPERPR